LFAAIVTLALVIERRIPSLSIFASGEIFRNWSRNIGELALGRVPAFTLLRF